MRSLPWARTGAAALCFWAFAAGCGGKVVVDASPGQGGSGGTGQGGAGQGGTGQGGTGQGGAGQGGSAGGCVSAGACDDGNACTTDSCNAGQCAHALLSTDDGNACTMDSCDPAQGVLHAPVAVDDGNTCTVDACDPATGVHHLPVSCDDQNLCTVDACDAAAGCQHVATSVDDGNACTFDTCDPVGGVSHLPLDCNDGDPCTLDLCDPMTGCVHQAPGALFSEHFDDNAAGWLLDSGWAIGAATLSSGQVAGLGTDPSNDHTKNQMGGGIAGVILGGNASPDVHPPYFLTSPVINLAGTFGPVTLEFYRILNSDYPPFMDSTVEVYDGTKWVNKFSVPPGVLIGENTSPGMTTWTKIQYDVSVEAAGNAAFRVRWGYSVLMGGVFSVGSWNIDDVRVLSGQLCP